MRPATGCDARSVRLKRFCTETTGTQARARSSSVASTFETPMCRIFPSARSSASAPSESSIGTAGSTVWSWKSSMRSSRSRRRLASHASRRCSGRPSALQLFGPERRKPDFVAITTSAGYGWSASASSSSLTSGPYESAVSKNVIPSRTACRSRSRRLRIGRRAPHARARQAHRAESEPLDPPPDLGFHPAHRASRTERRRRGSPICSPAADDLLSGRSFDYRPVAAATGHGPAAL
jgi:hypothetical protein